MPLTNVDPEIFMIYEGFVVYHAYEEDRLDKPFEDHFSMQAQDSDDTFDASLLAPVTEDYKPEMLANVDTMTAVEIKQLGWKRRIMYAIDTGEINRDDWACDEPPQTVEGAPVCISGEAALPEEIRAARLTYQYSEDGDDQDIQIEDDAIVRRPGDGHAYVQAWLRLDLMAVPADWMRDAARTQTLLLLTEYDDVPIGALEVLSDAELQKLELWATASHLSASDNNQVVVPPKPEWLKQFDKPGWQ